MPNKRVIDLSHHNVIPTDLKSTAAAGVWGVIHKATEGGTYVDEKVGARWHLAKEAGLLWGLYHFLRPATVASISKQVNNFMSAWTDFADENTLIALDWEMNENDNRPPTIDEALDWLRKVEERSGKVPVIYSGNVLKEAIGDDPHPIINDDYYRLWLAEYNPTPHLPPGFNKYWLWQWTKTGSISGVTPPTDLNDYQGTQESLKKEWTGFEGEVPGPEPTGKVQIAMTIPDGISAVIEVNGLIVFDRTG